MSGDFAIYAQRETTVPLAEILTAMRSRSVPVEWQSTFSSEQLEIESWTRGRFYPEGNTDSHSQISVSTEKLEEYMRSEALIDLDSDFHREALVAAQSLYQIATTGSAKSKNKRILANLIDVLAEMSNGLILDVETNHFYTPEEYRTQIFPSADE